MPGKAGKGIQCDTSSRSGFRSGCTVCRVKRGEFWIRRGRKVSNVGRWENLEAEPTIGYITLHREMGGFISTRRCCGDGIDTYEVGGGAEIYWVGITLVLFLKEGCEGAP